MDERLQGGCPPAPRPSLDQSSVPARPSQPDQPKGGGPKDLLCLGVAALLAFLWTLCVDELPMVLSAFFLGLGGLGTTLLLWGFFVACLLLRGGIKGLGRAALLLMAANLLLAVAPAMVFNAQLRLLNAIVLGICSLLAFALLAGGDEAAMLSSGGVARALGFFVREQFKNLGMLFSLRPSTGEGGRGIRSAVLGLLAGAAVLLLVVPLLASADAVFSGLVGDAFSWLEGDLELWLVRGLRLLLVGPLAFSLLFGLAHGHGRYLAAPKPGWRPAVSPLSLSCFLALIDSVYLVFVAIQFTYLFGGASSTAMYGGYAAYARSGFFQLVAVSAVNLVVVLFCQRLRRDAPRSAGVLALQLALLAATLVMLASAAWRMGLYVGCYGLSLLRALTYLGMLAIAALVALVALSLLRPRLPLFRLSLAVVVSLWLVFVFCNPVGRIASFNVDGYLSGSIEEIDVCYLGSLSPDAAPALRRLAEARPQFSDAVREQLDGFDAMAQSFSWPFRTLGQLISG